MREVAGAILLAGGLIAAAIWFKPTAPKFDMAVEQSGIVRLNVHTGEIINCYDGDCYPVASERGSGWKADPKLYDQKTDTIRPPEGGATSQK